VTKYLLAMMFTIALALGMGSAATAVTPLHVQTGATAPHSLAQPARWYHHHRRHRYYHHHNH
jgi:hypothetical protein